MKLSGDFHMNRAARKRTKMVPTKACSAITVYNNDLSAWFFGADPKLKVMISVMMYITTHNQGRQPVCVKDVSG